MRYSHLPNSTHCRINDTICKHCIRILLQTLHKKFELIKINDPQLYYSPGESKVILESKIGWSFSFQLAASLCLVQVSLVLEDKPPARQCATAECSTHSIKKGRKD